MQAIASTINETGAVARVTPAQTVAGTHSAYQGYKIIRRNGAWCRSSPKIAIAVTKAFLAVNGGQGAASARVRELVEQLTESVVRALVRSRPDGGTFHIEDIQDQVELALMRGGEHNVARAYVLYREKRTQERAQAGAGRAPTRRARAHRDRQRRSASARHGALRRAHRTACANLGDDVDRRADPRGDAKNLYDGVPMTRSTSPPSSPRAR